MDRVRTKFPGVYSRESETRRHQGKPDVCFDITWKQHGKKIWEKVGWKSEGYTAALAGQIRSERMRDARHGGLLPARDTGMTFAEAWKHYRALHGDALKSAPHDLSRYSTSLSKPLDAMRLSAITPKVLARLRNGLEAQGLAPQTVRHCLALVRRVLNKCRELGLWQGPSPFGKGSLPVVDNERWRWLTPEDAHRLLEALAERSRRTYRLALFSLHTGARAGEVLALRWQHVDFEGRLVHILDAKAGSRAVYMDATLEAMLREIGPGRPDDMVFTGNRGNAMKEIPDTFARTVAALGLNDGITDRRGKVVFHTLRHSFASWLAMDGAPMYEIAELLGQSELEMAQRYAKLSPGQKRDSVARLDERFRNAAHRSEPSGPPRTPADPSDRTE